MIRRNDDNELLYIYHRCWSGNIKIHITKNGIENLLGNKIDWGQWYIPLDKIIFKYQYPYKKDEALINSMFTSEEDRKYWLEYVTTHGINFESF